MPRRTIHRRRRAQGGCLSFAIGVLAVTALALIVAIVITDRLKPSADDLAGPGGTRTAAMWMWKRPLPTIRRWC